MTTTFYYLQIPNVDTSDAIINRLRKILVDDYQTGVKYFMYDGSLEITSSIPLVTDAFIKGFFVNTDIKLLATNTATFPCIAKCIGPDKLKGELVVQFTAEHTGQVLYEKNDDYRKVRTGLVCSDWFSVYNPKVWQILFSPTV